ncbi:MAG: zf-HC2 domain-containing protein [Brachymonas denitrificans]|uniref:anti-sigma factor family protein n=1 Tax=Brachymonas denitrificans TaxID=28220 RepID=UPI001BD0220C|nr:zf-HC2 domain-containing protein [Brachymonas denitrificans]
MNCPPTDDLSAYLDNALPAAEHEQVAQHLLHCPLCQRQLQVFTGLQHALHALPTPPLGFDLAANLQDRLHAHPNTRAPSSRPGHSRPGLLSGWFGWLGGAPGGVAAGIALAAGLWLGGGLLPAATVGNAADMGGVRVFDPVPPGGLCAAPELCRMTRTLP